MSRSTSLLGNGDDSYSYRGHLNEDTHRTSDFGPSGGGLSSSASLFYQKNRKLILIAAGASVALLLLIIIIAVATSKGGGGGDGPSPPPVALSSSTGGGSSSAALPPSPSSGSGGLPPVVSSTSWTWAPVPQPASTSAPASVFVKSTLGGMTAYAAGASSNPILLYLPDINGVNTPNNANLALAASYASAGFYVWVLDYFDGTNGFAPNSWTIDNSTARTRMAVAEVRQKMPGRSIFSTGYCWGGGVGVQLTYADASMPSVGDAMVDVSVVAHAAQVSVARYAMTVSPLFAVMPQNDAGFNNNAGAYINTITCSGCRGREAMFKVYPGVSHGFAVTANISDSNAVLQKQAAFDDTVAFFNAHLPTSQPRTAPPQSQNITLGSMNTLQIGSGNKLLLYLMDINGWAPPAVALATAYATAGFNVFMPDYFFGYNGRTCGCDVDSTTGLARLAVADLRKMYPGRQIFSTGYCWGGGVGLRLASGDNQVDAAAVAHASSVTSAVFNATVAPVFAAMPQNDAGFNVQVPSFMASLTCTGPTCRGREAAFKVYPGVGHGFAVSVNISDANAVLQKARSFNDTVSFFNLHQI